MKRLKITPALAMAMLIHSTANASGYDDALESLKAGNNRQAVVELKSHIQSTPSDTQARSVLAKIYLDAGQWASAEKEFVKISEIRKLSKEESVGLANAYLQQSKVDNISSIINISSLDLTDTAWRQTQVKQAFLKEQLGVAKSIIDELKKTDNNQTTQLLQAELNIYEREYDKAEAILQNILSSDQNNIEATQLLARSHTLQNQPKQAAEYYEKVLQNRGFLTLDELGRVIESYFKLNDIASADKHIANLAKVSQNNPITYFYQGISAYFKKDFALAREQLNSALATSENFTPAMYYLAMTNIELSEFNQARKHLTRLTEANPSNISYQLAMTKLLLKTDERELAISRLDRLAGVKESQLAAAQLLLPLYVSDNEFDKTIDLFKKIDFQDSNSKINLATLAATSLIKQGATAQAEEIVNLLPESPELHLLKAIVSNEQKNYDDALASLSKIENDEAIRSKVLPIKAKILYNQEKYADSINTYNLVLETNPDDLKALHGSALSYIASNKIKEAIGNYETIFKLAPNRSDAPINIVTLYQQLEQPQSAVLFINSNWKNVTAPALREFATFTAKQQDFEEADQQFKRLLSIDKSSEDTAIIYSGYVAMRGDVPAAIQFIETWGSDFQPTIKTRLHQASLYERVNETEKATSIYEALLEEFPNNPLVLNNAAWFMKGHNVDTAYTLADKAYNLSPNNPSIRHTHEVIMKIKEAIQEKL